MTYTPIYSNMGRIENRITQIDVTMTPQILVYQQYIDSKIDTFLRSVLGRQDANGFRLLLPLTGDSMVIDISTMNITIPKTSDIEMAADDCIIAKFFLDEAENYDRVQKAEENLTNTIQQLFGCSTSVTIDFSTEYLAANKILLPNGVPLALPSNAGVLLWKY